MSEGTCGSTDPGRCPDRGAQAQPGAFLLVRKPSYLGLVGTQREAARRLQRLEPEVGLGGGARREQVRVRGRRRGGPPGPRVLSPAPPGRLPAGPRELTSPCLLALDRASQNQVTTATALSARSGTSAGTRRLSAVGPAAQESVHLKAPELVPRAPRSRVSFEASSPCAVPTALLVKSSGPESPGPAFVPLSIIPGARGVAAGGARATAGAAEAPCPRAAEQGRARGHCFPATDR